MKEIMLMERKKASESIPGLMGLYMKETGSTTESTEKEYTNGRTEENTMESGKIMTWKAMEYTSGQTEGNMKVNTKMTRSMDLVSIFGLMVGAMKAIGGKENSME